MEVQKTAAPALDRGLSIIEYIAEKGSAVSLKQISKDLNIPSASAFRLLKTLANRGYVYEINNGQLLYMMGLKILCLADIQAQHMPLQSTAKPYMIQLAQTSKQTVQLGILMEGGTLVYIDQAVSSSPISIVAPLYQPIPLNHSASGKILFSYLPDDIMRSVLENTEFQEGTIHTIMDKELFFQDAMKSRTRGYAVDQEEFSLGIGCIAVPIITHNHSCAAALGLTGAIHNYTDAEKFQELLNMLQTTAQKLSAALGASIPPDHPSGR